MKRELVSLRLAPLINAKCRKSLKGMVIALAMSDDAEPASVLQGALQSCSVGGNMVVVSGRSEVTNDVTFRLGYHYLLLSLREMSLSANER